MKNKLNDLIYYIAWELVENGMLNEEKSYEVIKEFVHEMCENQKVICAENADIEDVDVEWDDDGKQVIWGVKESSILECKNVADEL